MTIKRREEAVSLALNGRKIAFCVLVAAARLKQLLDRLSIGKRRLVNLDAGQILGKAFFFDPRPLRFLARDAQFIERLSQALRHAGRQDGQIAKGRQRLLRLPNRVEERRCTFEPAQPRPLDIAGATRGAKPVQLVAKLFDVLVEFYPCIAAEFFFANCGACSVEALERLVETAVFAGARGENAVRFAFKRATQFGETPQAGRRRQEARANVAVRLQHFLAAGSATSPRPVRTTARTLPG